MFNTRKMHTHILSLLIQNTVYLKRSEIIESIRLQLVQWNMQRAKDKRLYINCYPHESVNGNKIGSEQWLYVSCMDLLPDHTIIMPTTVIENNSEILYIDDWSLSGNNAAAQLEHILYKRSYKDILYTFIFHTVTDRSICTIDEIVSMYPCVASHCILCTSKVPEFDSILHTNGIDQSDVAAFNKVINPDTECGAYAILSDYKLPNQFGSYPTVYEKLYTVDRIFMQEIESLWSAITL